MMRAAGVRIGCGLLLGAWLAGCGGGTLQPDAGGGLGGTTGTTGTGGTYPTGWGNVPNRNVDMLFMIDNSSGMDLAQANLERNFPTLMTALKNSPAGLPNIHLAVITSDMGAGDGSIANCDSTGGRNGIFQYTARGACDTTGLATGATYIVDTGNVRNYTGNLEDVFACIAALGETGCGFEHQLASMARALGADGKAPPQENQGFLRPEALLFIVLVTNEDDCSASPGSALYDTTQTSLTSALGPPANFRCNEFGHLCGGAKPPRLAPTGSVTDSVTLDGCVSAEDAGMLIPVANVVAQLRSLKRFPDEQVVVAAIAGPDAPYTVKWRSPPTADTGPWPEIAHSCVATDASVADPAVRIAQFVRTFGANGLLLSACSDNYAPSLQRLAEHLNSAP
jgi:hypothetical protein